MEEEIRDSDWPYFSSSSSSGSEEEEDAYTILSAVNQALPRNVPRHQGRSVYGHAFIDYRREEGHARLVVDYFHTPPCFGESTFHWRFRMYKPLFLRILGAVEAHDR